MLEFLSAPYNLPFTGALLLLAVIGIVQIIGLLMGMDFMDSIETLIPDTSGLDGAHFSIALFGWLELGKVPIVLSVVIFLTAFGLLGLNIQALLIGSGLFPLPAIVTVPPVLILSMVPLKWGNRILAHLIPGETTAAVSGDSFIGRIATITIGTAKADLPAEAKLTGPLGRSHYVMIYPDNPEDILTQNTEVLIVGRKGEHFTAIPNLNKNLSLQ